MRTMLNSVLLFCTLAILQSCNGGDFSLSAPLTEKDKTAINVFDHNPYLHTSCIECHEYQRPKRTPVHGDNANCIECHSAELDKYGKRTWLNLTKFKHSVGILTCNQCHMTRDRDSRPNPKENHPTIKYVGLDCVYCHVYKDNSKTWKDITFDHLKHLPAPQTCNQCHESVRPNSHKINPTTDGMKSTDCVSCHGSNTDWKSQLKKYDHSNARPQACNQRHKFDAPRPIENHPSIKENFNKLDCVLCHSYSITNGSDKKSWKNLIFNQKDHSASVTTCLNCHRDLNDSRPTTLTHNQFSRKDLDCIECHTFVKNTGWSKFGTFNHNKTETKENCESCHNSNSKILKSKNNDHVKTGLACIECHNTNAWKPATYKHAKEDSNCLSCHNGKTASIKPIDHTIKGPDQCSICHDQNNWKPAWYNKDYKHSANGNMPNMSVRGTLQSHPRSSECSLCHDMKSESVNYTTKEFAGTCLGCHLNEFQGEYHHGQGAPRMRNCLECHKYNDWRI